MNRCFSSWQFDGLSYTEKIPTIGGQKNIFRSKIREMWHDIKNYDNYVTEILYFPLVKNLRTISKRFLFLFLFNFFIWVKKVKIKVVERINCHKKIFKNLKLVFFLSLILWNWVRILWSVQLHSYAKFNN